MSNLILPVDLRQIAQKNVICHHEKIKSRDSLLYRHQRIYGVYSLAGQNNQPGFLLPASKEIRPADECLQTSFLRTNLFKMDQATFKKLVPHFEEVFTTYDRSGRDHHLEARIKLLALLCHMKEFVAERKQAVRYVSFGVQKAQQVIEFTSLSKFLTNGNLSTWMKPNYQVSIASASTLTR